MSRKSINFNKKLKISDIDISIHQKKQVEELGIINNYNTIKPTSIRLTPGDLERMSIVLNNISESRTKKINKNILFRSLLVLAEKEKSIELNKCIDKILLE